MTQPSHIIGAGLSGLILGHIFPTARIMEKEPAPKENHQALLRFRSDTVAKVTGIDFTPVQVRKGIFHSGEFKQPNIKLANWYAQKCLRGKIGGDRSIWNLDPVTRWIAPFDFYHRMIDQLDLRIEWDSENRSWSNDMTSEPAISTMPLPALLNAIDMETDLAFDRAPVYVIRGKLDCVKNTYQTIYYPNLETELYRASITDDLLICEFVRNPHDHGWHSYIRSSFGLPELGDVTGWEPPTEQYGKIQPLPDEERRAILALITDQYNIYSIGRYATWRNILLDDVVQDASRVKQLMGVTAYERKLFKTQ